MSISNILFGAFAGLCGVAALMAGLFRRDIADITLRLLSLTFGVTFVVYGILHLAEGVGASWATPQLRSRLYLWFVIPCLSAWLVAWFMGRLRRKR
jgi:hypothetical protein